MNNNDFVNEQIEEIKKGNKKILWIVWVAAGLVWAYRVISPTTTLIIGGIPITSLFVAIPLILLAVGATIWVFIRSKKELFDLYDQEVAPDEARKIIDEEVRRGEILLDEYSRPTEQESSPRFLLLPSYLVVRDLKLTAIPTKDITGVTFNFEKGNNEAVTYAHYRISTKEKTHSFDTNFAEEEYSQKLVDQLNNAIKNSSKAGNQSER